MLFNRLVKVSSTEKLPGQPYPRLQEESVTSANTAANKSVLLTRFFIKFFFDLHKNTTISYITASWFVYS